MKSNNIIQEKSFAFAIRIVNLNKHLITEKKEFILSKQLLRSGTSIGANVEEAIGAVSDKDFLNKLGIAYKEARESIYWLKLLQATDYITKEEYYRNINQASIVDNRSFQCACFIGYYRV